MKKIPPGVLIVSNLDSVIDDMTFTSERGTWNVSRAQRDCDAGKHGNPWLLDVEECYAANAGVEVEMAKVFWFLKNPEILAKPGIAVMEDGKAWFIEGHHRLRALYIAGVKEFASWVIDDPAPYIVWFNGKRKL